MRRRGGGAAGAGLDHCTPPTIRKVASPVARAQYDSCKGALHRLVLGESIGISQQATNEFVRC